MTNPETEQVRQIWEDQAAKWYEQRAMLFAASRPVHEWMVRNLDPQPGQRVLELAAGTGDTGFLVAPRLGDGRLVSSDLAPGMVEAARRRGAELGVTNAEHRVLDAQAMDLSDASFDGVLCRWGFMLMPDPAAALRECHRILVPGGRLSFAVFTGPDENPWASIPARILIAGGHLPKPTGGWQPGILALGDRARLQSLLDASPFATTQLEAVDMTWTFRDSDDYWDFLVEVTALGPVLRALPDAERRSVREEIDRQLSAFTGTTGVELPSRCWGGLAVR